MSFKQDEFISYVTGKGLRSAKTYCSNLRRIEREFKFDIDIEYGRDGCTALSDVLQVRFNENRGVDKRAYNAIKQMRHSLKKYNDFRSNCNVSDTSNAKIESAVLTKKIEEILSSVDWSVKDVMIGTVRDSRQLEFILKYSGYYVPAHFITDDKLPIRYIALHEQGIGSEPGIRRYGEVLTVQKIKRSRIPVPMSRSNGDEPYYYFKVRLWEPLSHPVSIRDSYRGQPQFTNKFLLDNCTQSYQLFAISSAEEYRLMAVINKAFDNLSTSATTVYLINGTHILTLSDGYLTLTNDNGKLLDKISIGSFSFRPRESFNRIKKSIFN